MSDAHLLIVDDDALIRRLLRRVVALVQPTAHVYEAESVAQALRIVASAPLDVVISDYHLPDGLGTAVLAAVRARLPQCPVYLISGEPAAAGAAAEARATGFFAKPLDLNLLLRLLDAHLRQPGGADKPLP